MKELSNTEAELKKVLLIKKKRVAIFTFSNFRMLMSLNVIFIQNKALLIQSYLKKNFSKSYIRLCKVQVKTTKGFIYADIIRYIRNKACNVLVQERLVAS